MNEADFIASPLLVDADGKSSRSSLLEKTFLFRVTSSLVMPQLSSSFAFESMASSITSFLVVTTLGRLLGMGDAWEVSGNFDDDVGITSQRTLPFLRPTDIDAFSFLPYMLGCLLVNTRPLFSLKMSGVSDEQYVEELFKCLAFDWAPMACVKVLRISNRLARLKHVSRAVEKCLQGGKINGGQEKLEQSDFASSL